MDNDEWSIEIAYEAELNTKESPELLELARELVGEDQDNRSAAIDELRAMVYERGECSPRRLDDAFLLRFLRARKFVVRRSYRLLVRYCRFLQQYPDLYSGVDLFGLVRVGSIFDGTMYDHPSCGRLAIMRARLMNPKEYDVVLRATMAMLEIGLRQPKLQVLGVTAILDLGDVTAAHLTHFTPTIVHQMACFIDGAIPVLINSCHVINYNWLISSLFHLIQRYVSPSLRERLFFHGQDLESLRRHIEPSCLPPRYGGSCGAHHNTFGFWLNKIKQYRDECFDKEMEEFGYVIKE